MWKYLLPCVLAVFIVACSTDEKESQSQQGIENSNVNQNTNKVDTPRATDLLESKDNSQSIEKNPQTSSPSTISTESNTSQSTSTQPQAKKTKSDALALYAKCAPCHGKDGKSVAPGSVGNVLLASLHKAQVIESLKGFRARTLSKGGNSVIMYMQTKNLSDEDIEALASYIDSL